MSNWFITASEQWLEPLYDRLKELLLCDGILHADGNHAASIAHQGKADSGQELHVVIQDERLRRAPIVLYDYQPNRKAENTKNFLRGFKGWLHTDGYTAYRGIDGVTVVGCWAHARRKFCEAVEVLKEEQRTGSTAAKGLDYCNKLYSIERKIKDINFEDRLKERQEHSKNARQGCLLSYGRRAVLASIYRGRQIGNRQQPRRAEYQAVCNRQEELSVRQHAVRRKSECNHFQHHRNGKRKRIGSVRLLEIYLHQSAESKGKRAHRNSPSVERAGCLPHNGNSLN